MLRTENREITDSGQWNDAKTGLGAHPASYKMGTDGSSPGAIVGGCWILPHTYN